MSTARTGRAARRETTTSQIAPNDLIIVADDGNIYLVKEEIYKSEPLPEQLSWQTKELLSLGCVVANIPANIPGVGAACYLVDLQSLGPAGGFRRTSEVEHLREEAQSLNPPLSSSQAASLGGDAEEEEEE